MSARLVLLALSLLWADNAQAAPLNRVGHIIVLYLENRAFDNLYGFFPGADGLRNGMKAPPQVDKDGKVYAVLPPVMETSKKPPQPDHRFPPHLPNKPFDIGLYVPIDQATGDLVHRFYQEQMQIDGGKMDKFAAVSDAGGLTMGYYRNLNLPLMRFARQYVLADHFFHAAFGGSFLNHMWLACACTPRYEGQVPDGLKAKLDPQGHLVKDGVLTPEGFAVNTMQSAFMPHSVKITDKSALLPPLHLQTIGDRLDAKGIDWAWYSGGFNDAVAGHPDPSFQFHHQPFAYFAQYGDGTPGRAKHLKDETDFVKAIESGTLPPVAFFKPLGIQNEHPGYADVMTGENHTAALIDKIRRSRLWKDSVIIVTYDEHGGFWDHVPPPKVDGWGPGSRVPTLVISPFITHHKVDHTVYDTTSILKLIEERYGLAPLTDRDARVTSLGRALQ